MCFCTSTLNVKRIDHPVPLYSVLIHVKDYRCSKLYPMVCCGIWLNASSRQMYLPTSAKYLPKKRLKGI